MIVDIVSEQQEAREQNMTRNWNGYIRNTTDGVIVLNEHFQVEKLNTAASLLLERPTSETCGRECVKVLHCKSYNHVELCGTPACPLVRVLENKIPLPNEELVIGTTADHDHKVSVSVTPMIAENGKTEVVFVAREVASLEVANRVRTNFVSMVSHELRTPLNSVHGFIDILLRGYVGELTYEQKTYLGYAQEGVQQLIALTEDILFMTRSDVGLFEIKQQEVPFRALVRQVVGSLQPQAQKAEVIITQDIPTSSPSLYIDPLRIIQVLNNLITNAIKFTPPGGIVTVSMRQYDTETAVVTVSDTGFGIPIEDQPHVFERFYQSDHHEQSKMGGYGLGLAIAKLIVEQHKGTIDFDTIVNQGTSFSFTLPFYKKK